jgi:selenide,water dikinase
MKRLVLVGGGHAHVEVLRRFGHSPVPDVDITLISPGRNTAYSAMLPGLVAGHYGWRACHIDLEVLSRFAGARFLRDIAVGIDLERKVVRCADSVEVPYDVVSLDVGSAPDARAISQAGRVALPRKPVDRFLSAWDGVVQLAGERDLSMAIIGADVEGIELCLAMQYRLAQRAPHGRARFTLLAHDDILTGQSVGVRRRLERILRERNVSVRARSAVAAVGERELMLEDGDRVAADRAVWIAGQSAPRWLSDSGLRTDAAGFVLTDECLRCLSHADVFAVGDAASMTGYTAPPSGVRAVRQGPALAENLRLVLRDQPPRTVEHHAVALQLIGTGDNHAIASWGALSTEGAWVWRWKDSIDRRFIARYRVADRTLPVLRSSEARR